MQSFEELLKKFENHFNTRHFPAEPASLYDAAQHILGIGGKRVRPVICLMGNELFDEIKPDAWHVATAIELFHNFTLIHDDIMDVAPLRRGKPTVHDIHGVNTAILAGDVTNAMAYEHLAQINTSIIQRVLSLFNKTSFQVCEGQQLDMDFETRGTVSFDEYVKMIELKTSVLLAASLKLGAMIGGASVGNTEHIYEFGRNLGIAFQVQDDYLDAFGDPAKFGKQVGGDIKANKKTFLMIHAVESASTEQKIQLLELMQTNPANKVQQVLSIFTSAGVDAWAMQLKNEYLEKAMKHLDDIAVMSKRKEPLKALAEFLVKREY